MWGFSWSWENAVTDISIRLRFFFERVCNKLQNSATSATVHWGSYWTMGAAVCGVWPHVLNKYALHDFPLLQAQIIEIV